MKLYDHSKVYLVATDTDSRKFMGVGSVRSFAYFLADKHGERGNPNGPNTVAKLTQMERLGHVKFNNTHYIVEKAIPIELRKDLRNDRIDVKDVLTELER